jgi:hypothetical protein
MHSATEAISPVKDVVPAVIEPTKEVKAASVTPEPQPVSPMGFSVLAGLIGLAGGMVLAPWLERWYHRATKHTREEDDNE